MSSQKHVLWLPALWHASNKYAQRTHWERLCEAFVMSNHGLCFCVEIRKKCQNYLSGSMTKYTFYEGMFTLWRSKQKMRRHVIQNTFRHVPQQSLWSACTVWSEVSLSASKTLGSLAVRRSPSEDSNQPAWTRRLIWGFTGCIFYMYKVYFITFQSWFIRKSPESSNF